MSDLLYWLADNVTVWRPLAVLALAGIAVVCIAFWFSVWMSER